MPYPAGRTRLFAGSAPVAKAPIRLALIATALAVMGGSRAVHAQGTAPSWRGDLGGSVSPVYKSHIDVRSCCIPFSGWVTWGTGKFRVQLDYLQNRNPHRWYLGNPEERGAGQVVIADRARLDLRVVRVAGVSQYWRLAEHPQLAPYVLIGIAFRHEALYICVAAGDPVVPISTPRNTIYPDDPWYRVDFAEGEEQRCLDESPSSYPNPQLMMYPRARLGLDVLVGSRFFARAELGLLEVRIGAGLRF